MVICTRFPKTFDFNFCIKSSYLLATQALQARNNIKKTALNMFWSHFSALSLLIFLPLAACA